MLRAVPETVRIAGPDLWVEIDKFNFCDFSTCFLVTLPTLLRFGSGEPLAFPRRATATPTLAGIEDKRESAVV